MNCPPEIASVLLRLMRVGLLRIRAGSTDPDRVVIEADHIHNLPEMVRDFSGPLLTYYWEVERPSYMMQTPDSDLGPFQPIWDELRHHVEATRPAVSTS